MEFPQFLAPIISDMMSVFVYPTERDYLPHNHTFRGETNFNGYFNPETQSQVLTNIFWYHYTPDPSPNRLTSFYSRTIYSDSTDLLESAVALIEISICVDFSASLVGFPIDVYVELIQDPYAEHSSIEENHHLSIANKDQWDQFMEEFVEGYIETGFDMADDLLAELNEGETDNDEGLQ